jgi:hypothetical protein
MKSNRILTLLTILGALLLGACAEDYGPAENFGERVDDAVSDARDRAEEAADEIREAGDEIGDALRDN